MNPTFRFWLFLAVAVGSAVVGVIDSRPYLITNAMVLLVMGSLSDLHDKVREIKDKDR